MLNLNITEAGKRIIAGAEQALMTVSVVPVVGIAWVGLAVVDVSAQALFDKDVQGRVPVVMPTFRWYFDQITYAATGEGDLRIHPFGQSDYQSSR